MNSNKADPAHALSAATDPFDLSRPSIDDIEAAARILAGKVVRTPTIPAAGLSSLSGGEVFLKLENLQATGSFKDRGSYVRLADLSEKERAAGVIACSAGNHAQGVAYHAQKLGIHATIIMPEGTPFSKITRTEAHGADVRIAGDGLDGAEREARAIIEREGQIFIHPYDDPRIIAGQGTIGLELLADHPDLDVIIVPIGGGGLIAGIALAAKALRPQIRVIGVQSKLYPHMLHALQGDSISVPANPGQSLAEGIAVKRPGILTRAIIRDLVDDLILVDEQIIETAVHYLVETQKIIAEGAGVAAVAAMLADPVRFAGCKVAIPICGGNIDTRLLATLLLRGLIRDGRMIRLRIEIDDRPGALGQVCQVIGAAGGNIVEVQHRRFYYDIPVKQAELDIMVETKSREHVTKIREQLSEKSFVSRLLTDMALTDQG